MTDYLTIEEEDPFIGPGEDVTCLVLTSFRCDEPSSRRSQKANSLAPEFGARVESRLARLETQASCQRP